MGAAPLLGPRGSNADGARTGGLPVGRCRAALDPGSLASSLGEAGCAEEEEEAAADR
ncbi:hypothetical protein ACFWIB_22225 [Streptomyces sp. NPDC127051]|uniref:hypothetical protein n=1 Tax=Streptomyces sp. NPDC127051 TaxID=3347119 RepID=UPI00364D36A2